MNPSIEYQNLASIANDFRNEGRALRGYQKLKTDLNNTILLMEVLRDHRKRPITKSFEIEYRDEVDFLLKYYSLLELGIITGYIPHELTPDIKNEVKDILGNKYVKKYYQQIYPLKLPELLYQHVNGSTSLPARPDSKNIFEQILLLDSLLDDDVENFLWMLDSGRTNGKSIHDLNALLSDKNQISALLEKPREDENALDGAFWGFIKFTDYMVRYKNLIEECDDDLVSAAVWHYQSYWFQNMKNLMEDRYIHAIRLIEKLKNDISFDEFVATKSDKTGIDLRAAEKEYAEWQLQASAEVNKILTAVDYLLDQGNGDALNHYEPDEKNIFILHPMHETLVMSHGAHSLDALIISDQERTKSIIAEVTASMKLSTASFPTLNKDALKVLEHFTPKFVLLDFVMATVELVKIITAVQSFYGSIKETERPSIIVVDRENKSIHLDKVQQKQDDQTKLLMARIESSIKSSK